MKILNDDVSLLETLLIRKVIHEVKETSLLTAIDEGVFTFGKLLIELNVLGALLENIVKHIHVMPMDPFGSQHVDDGNGEDEYKKKDETKIAHFDQGFNWLLFADCLSNKRF